MGIVESRGLDDDDMRRTRGRWAEVVVYVKIQQGLDEKRRQHEKKGKAKTRGDKARTKEVDDVERTNGRRGASELSRWRKEIVDAEEADRRCGGKQGRRGRRNGWNK